MTYTAVVEYSRLGSVETKYIIVDEMTIAVSSNEDVYHIGDFSVARSNFISVHFYDAVEDEDSGVDENDTSTDRVKEIADLVLEELTKSGKVKTYATGGVLPEPKTFGGSGITTTPDPIPIWNTPDTFESPRPAWSVEVTTTPGTVEDVAKQVSRELAFRSNKEDDKPKTSLERAVEESRRGAY